MKNQPPHTHLMRFPLVIPLVLFTVGCTVSRQIAAQNTTTEPITVHRLSLAVPWLDSLTIHPGEIKRLKVAEARTTGISTPVAMASVGVLSADRSLLAGGMKYPLPEQFVAESENWMRSSWLEQIFSRHAGSMRFLEHHTAELRLKNGCQYRVVGEKRE